MPETNYGNYKSSSESNLFDNIQNESYYYSGQNEYSNSVSRTSQEELDRKKKEKERNQSMSYAHAILEQNCIVMASDSRNTHVDDHGYIQWYDDGMQKVVYLPKAHLGLVATGINTMNGRTICDLIMEMDEEVKDADTVEESFRKITENLKSYLPDENAVINIACGGYENGRAVLFSTNIKKNETISISESDFMWNGGYDSSAVKLFKKYETLSDEDARVKTFKKGENQNIVLEDKTLTVNIPSIKTLIDFSNFMMQVEINRAKFTASIPVAGGSIQTLLLTPDGEKWIHTLY